MHDDINVFQTNLSRYFNEMKLGVAFSAIGKYVHQPESILIAQQLGPGMIEEPIPLSSLIQHSDGVASGVTELFVVRSIAAWNDLLSAIFRSSVSAHLDGRKKFPSFKNRKSSFDFSSSASPLNQIQDSINKEFAFMAYKDRLKTITSCLESKRHIDIELMFIKKHVEIRNSFQHHNGVVTLDLLKDIGNSKLELIGENFETVALKENEKILLTAGECANLKSALFTVSNVWRGSNADL